MARHDIPEKFPFSFLASPTRFPSPSLCLLPCCFAALLFLLLLLLLLLSINKTAPAARLYRRRGRHLRVVWNSAAREQPLQLQVASKAIQQGGREQPAAATAGCVCHSVDPSISILQTNTNQSLQRIGRAMADARIAAARTDFALAFADEPAPPETLDVVRRQRQLLRRAAALCLDPIAEETDGGVDSAPSDVPSFGGQSQSQSQTTTSALPARP